MERVVELIVPRGALRNPRNGNLQAANDLCFLSNYRLSCGARLEGKDLEVSLQFILYFRREVHSHS